jgi:16S rRNA (adenine(1408)-N(1))-methyltransferase
LQASAEALPEELNGIAQEVFVLYPWGSLLRGVLAPKADVIRSLRRICRENALLRIVVAIDPERDQTEIQRLDLDPGNDLKTRLICRYSEEGFAFASDQALELRTTWSKRLGQNQNRAPIHLCFRAR